MIFNPARTPLCLTTVMLSVRFATFAKIIFESVNTQKRHIYMKALCVTGTSRGTAKMSPSFAFRTLVQLVHRPAKRPDQPGHSAANALGSSDRSTEFFSMLVGG
jgi:hypothetical protein